MGGAEGLAGAPGSITRQRFRLGVSTVYDLLKYAHAHSIRAWMRRTGVRIPLRTHLIKA
jgi:hypothetical protein